MNNTTKNVHHPRAKARPATRAKARTATLLPLAGLLFSGGAYAQLCNGGAAVTGPLTVSSSCDGWGYSPLTAHTGADITIDPGVYVTNDAGSGRFGDPISIFNTATGVRITNHGTIATGNQWAITVNGGIESLVNYGTISSDIRRAIVLTNGGNAAIGTLTNLGTISGPFSDITNTGGVMSTLNNLQGAAGGNALRLSGDLPLAYNVIIRSATNYGQFTNNGAVGTMAFNIYGNTGTTLVAGVAASTVEARTYTGVLQGFTSLAGITGTTGTYAAYSYNLVADANTANAWNLVVTNYTPNYLRSAGISASSPVAPAISTLNGMVGTAANSGSVLNLTNYLGGLNGNNLASELTKLNPSQTIGLSQGTFGFSASSQGLIANRLAAGRGDTTLSSVRGQDGMLGMAAGDTGRAVGLWMRGFGSDARQNNQDAFDGYKSRSYGIAIGADTDLHDDLRVGAAFTYADTKVDISGVRSGDSGKIRSYQLTAYGSKAWGAVYADAMAAYGENRYGTRRAVPAGMVANGSYNGSLWSARVEAGVRMAVSPMFHLIPLASLTWNQLNSDGYTETGGGGANLTYGGQRTTSLKSGLGLRLTTAGSGSRWLPEVHAIWNHEFKDRRVDTSASYAGGTAFVARGMSVGADSYNLGGGVTYTLSRGKSISLAYDYEGRSGYTSNAVKMTGRWEF